MHSDADRLSIADLLAALGDRSFGAVLLALALPATVMPPLASAVIGAPMMIVSFQLLFRRGGPRIPERLARLSIDRRRASATSGWFVGPVSYPASRVVLRPALHGFDVADARRPYGSRPGIGSVCCWSHSQGRVSAVSRMGACDLLRPHSGAHHDWRDCRLETPVNAQIRRNVGDYSGRQYPQRPKRPCSGFSCSRETTCLRWVQESQT